MPRKTASPVRPHRRPDPGFNEAAARCLGKPGLRVELDPTAGRASMRPRPDAAENAQDCTIVGRVHVPASMRPRPDAAEN